MKSTKYSTPKESPSILYIPHLIQNIIRESEKTQENIAFNRAKRSQFKAGYQNAAGNKQDSMTDTHKTHTPKESSNACTCVLAFS